MKILWISHLLPYPPHGGVRQRSYNLLREVAICHDVHLVSLFQRDHQPTPEEHGQAEAGLKQICCSVSIFPMRTNRPILKYGWVATTSLLPGQSYLANWVRSTSLARHLSKMVQEHHFDVVHFDTIGLAQYHRIVCKIPSVMNHHNIESHMMFRRASKEELWHKRLFYRMEGLKRVAYERERCPQFSTNLTVSQLDEERLKQIAPGISCDVIPNGVDINYFRPSRNEPDPNSLIFVGSLGWYPNKDAMEWFADSIWPLIKRKIPTVQMTVVGPNPSRRLLRLAQEDHSFKVTGWVDDVRPYLERACVYVCPIRDGGGTKLKLLDAMAAGKAIVATALACEGINVHNDVHIKLADTQEQFAATTALLLGDEARRRILAQESRRLSEEVYSFKGIGRKLMDVYERVARAYRVPR